MLTDWAKDYYSPDYLGSPDDCPNRATIQVESIHGQMLVCTTCLMNSKVLYKGIPIQINTDKLCQA